MTKKLIIPLILISIILTSIMYLSNTGTTTLFTTITPSEFKQKSESSDYTILDVRTAEEYKQGHIKNAQNIDYYQTDKFIDELKKLDKNKKYLVYCRSGNRSTKTLEIMRAQGFANVEELQGGITSWTSKQLPLEPCQNC